MKTKKKISIAFMVNELNTLHGVGKVVTNLSSVLCERYDCYLITMWDNGTKPYNINKEIKVYSLFNEHRRIRNIFVESINKLKEIIEQNNISILFIHGRGNGIIPFFVKFFTDVKIVHCEHFALKAYDYQRLSIKQKIMKILHGYLIKNVSDRIVVLTKKAKEYYYKECTKCTNIYNPIDLESVSYIPKYNNFSKKIITVGRIELSKGYEYLIDVAEIVLKKHPDWVWHIYGDGDILYKKSLQADINRRKLNSQLFFLGTCADMSKVYCNYSIYVMTSRWEGLPMVLLEAKANKLPIVSFDIETGPSEIVRDGIDGYLISSFDTIGMSCKINDLINSPIKREKFSENSLGNINKFDIQEISKKWIDLIEELKL